MKEYDKLKIDYKYTVGQAVYYHFLKSTPLPTTCTTCNGAGYLLKIDNSKITCPVCDGEKTITDQGSLKYEVVENFVDSVCILICNDNKITIEYVLEIDYPKDCKSKPEYELYSTFEEAEKTLPNSKYMGYSKF